MADVKKEKKTEFWLLVGMLPTIVIIGGLLVWAGYLDPNDWVSLGKWAVGAAMSYVGMRTGKKSLESWQDAKVTKQHLGGGE